MKNKIVYVIGTRPEIIRSAFIIKKLKEDPEVDFKLLHTGQHYSYLMDKVFFDELKVPPPDINLGVGSKTHTKQIAEIMVKTEEFFNQFKPNMACVFGDTNSTLAVAIVAVKMNIPLCHIEAGFREWEMDLPEEANRRLTDHSANLLLALSQNMVNNLKTEKVLGIIYNTGDPQYEIFQYYYKKASKINLLKTYKLKKNSYILLTIHRDKNVDNIQTLLSILNELNNTSLPIVFPLHPRTRKQLEIYNPSYYKKLPNILFIEPLKYVFLLHILSNALMVVTDSGGLQKEVFWAKKPCITLKTFSGWVETVNLGVNFLTDPTDGQTIGQTVQYVLKNNDQITKKFQNITNPYYKKDCSENIVKLIKQYAGKSW